MTVVRLAVARLGTGLPRVLSLVARRNWRVDCLTAVADLDADLYRITLHLPDVDRGASVRRALLSIPEVLAARCLASGGRVDRGLLVARVRLARDGALPAAWAGPGVRVLRRNARTAVVEMTGAPGALSDALRAPGAAVLDGALSGAVTVASGGLGPARRGSGATGRRRGLSPLSLPQAGGTALSDVA